MTLTFSNPLPDVEKNTFFSEERVKQALSNLTPDRFREMDVVSRRKAEELYDTVMQPVPPEILHKPFEIIKQD